MKESINEQSVRILRQEIDKRDKKTYTRMSKFFQVISLITILISVSDILRQKYINAIIVFISSIVVLIYSYKLDHQVSKHIDEKEYDRCE